MTAKQQSSLMEEVSKAQETLHGLFDEIGLTRCDREGRQESLFAALNTALQDQMRSVIAYVPNPQLLPFDYVLLTSRKRKKYIG